MSSTVSNVGAWGACSTVAPASWAPASAGANVAAMTASNAAHDTPI